VRGGGGGNVGDCECARRSAGAQKSLEVTSGNEGIEWVKNEPYDNTGEAVVTAVAAGVGCRSRRPPFHAPLGADGHWGVSPITGIEVPRNRGQYTLKRYHLKTNVPSAGEVTAQPQGVRVGRRGRWRSVAPRVVRDGTCCAVAALVPSNGLFLIEEAWNGYPHCRTVLVNGYLSKDKCVVGGVRGGRGACVLQRCHRVLQLCQRAAAVSVRAIAPQHVTSGAVHLPLLPSCRCNAARHPRSGAREPPHHSRTVASRVFRRIFEPVLDRSASLELSQRSRARRSRHNVAMRELRPAACCSWAVVCAAFCMRPDAPQGVAAQCVAQAIAFQQEARAVAPQRRAGMAPWRSESHITVGPARAAFVFPPPPISTCLPGPAQVPHRRGDDARGREHRARQCGRHVRRRPEAAQGEAAHPHPRLRARVAATWSAHCDGDH
jgi:hypothetical protein